VIQAELKVDETDVINVLLGDLSPTVKVMRSRREHGRRSDRDRQQPDQERDRRDTGREVQDFKVIVTIRIVAQAATRHVLHR